MFWLVYESDRGPCVILQPARSLIHARMVAGVNQLDPGRFVEGHELPKSYIRKIPKDKIGKCLSQRQAAQLLKHSDNSS